jgi:hypothetical protein
MLRRILPILCFIAFVKSPYVAQGQVFLQSAGETGKDITLLILKEISVPTVYYTYPTVAVFQDKPVAASNKFSGSWTVPTVMAGKGESEPIQLVVETSSDLSGVTWSCSDLTQAGGTILPASAIDIRVVGYAQINGQLWPDPLFPQPLNGVSVSTNTRRAWWITVNVPSAQAAGFYKGTLTLFVNTQKIQSISFSVKVGKFAYPFPYAMGVSVGCGISADVLPLAKTRHFYSHHCLRGVKLPNFTINRSSNEVTVDFTAFDQEVQALRSTYGMKYICLGFILGDASGDYYRSTSLHPNMTNELGQINRISIDPQDGAGATARFNSIFQQYAAHLSAQGWLNDAFIYLWDEPNTDVLLQEAARYAQYFHAAAPTLPVMVTCGPKDTLASVDVFCTMVNHLSDLIPQWLQNNDKRGWIYTCGNLQHPSLTIGKPTLDSRLFPWVAYRYRAENIVHWALDVNYAQQQLLADGLSFTNIPSSGDGCLFYPALSAGTNPLPSIRSENMRDGLEDVYLLLLAGNQGLETMCRDFVQSHIPDQFNYDANPSSYMDFRANLFEQIIPVLRPGDANGDERVDVGDLGILAANYGGSGKTWAQGDFDNDGRVDVGDLGILAAHYGEGATKSMNFNADYVKVVGTDVSDDTEDNASLDSSICGVVGLPVIVSLILMGLMFGENHKNGS